MPMTPLQERMHTEVCLAANLPVCLCGAYAKVGMEEIDRLKGMLTEAHDKWEKSMDAVERQRELMQWARPHIGDEYQRSWPDDQEFDEQLARYDAALSAGAGEK